MRLLALRGFAFAACLLLLTHPLTQVVLTPTASDLLPPAFSRQCFDNDQEAEGAGRLHAQQELHID